MEYVLNPIGFVISELKDVFSAPRQAQDNLKPAKIFVYPHFRPALDNLFKKQKILVFTWLHLAKRDVLKVHPGGNSKIPLHGVFATRSPHRPNPIGVHEVTILRIEEDGIIVHPIEAIDGTPVLDLKPCLPKEDNEANSIFFPLELIKETQKIGHLGWQRGLFAGYSGNISCKSGQRILITNTNTWKANLKYNDFTVFDLKTKEILNAGKPSSEAKMHLLIYENQPQAKAVLHTHPPFLNALFLNQKKLFDLSLFESKMFASCFTTISPYSPGSLKLALAVAKASRKYQIIYLQQHGLVVWGKDLKQVLALSEEIEALAKIKLNCC
ncbi:tRNA (N6-threonylcarbamoyladenosine(37)-N6)-methyltransferase TrmO [Desulfonauticus submarinus]